ncbi:MAG: oligosaccharide flippase family protein [Candidatus Aenigmarchaeota archaeon]|nr:oligosaccharide flippase family protein [Candidatus Aenigmarchaeota archaeon]
MVKLNISLLKASSMVFIAFIVSSLFNYLFQIYMGRVLGPADYGILGSLLSLLYIISVPSETIRTTVMKFASEFKTMGQFGEMKSLILKAMRKISLYGFVAIVIIYFISAPIAEFLHIPSTFSIIILGFIFLVGIIYPVTLGMLQGLQKFGHYGINISLSSMFKLGFGFLFVGVFGFAVNGALGAILLSSLFALVISIIPLKKILRTERVSIISSKIYRYSLPVFTAILFLTIISNIDVILVKHFFTPTEAGYYAAASLMAKMIYFISHAFSNAMFPKASELHVDSRHSGRILKESLFYTSIFAVLGIVLYFLIPHFIVDLLFGAQYSPVAELIGLFAIAITFLSLSNVIMMYDLAIKKTKFIYPLVFSVILEIVLIYLFHYDLLVIIKTLIGVTIILFSSLMIVNKNEFVSNDLNLSVNEIK